MEGDYGVVSSRNDGNAHLDREFARRRLVPERREVVSSGTDEANAVDFELAREVLVLGQEPVPGVHGLDAVLDAAVDDGVDVKVRADGGLAGANEEGLIGLVAVLGEAILVGEDANGGDGELGGSAHDAGGNLAAVGGKELAEGGGGSLPGGEGGGVLGGPGL